MRHNAASLASVSLCYLQIRAIRNGIVLLSIEYQMHYNVAAAPSRPTPLVLRERHANSLVATS